MNRSRQKRFQQFFAVCNVTKETRILDVGGLPYDWIDLGFEGQVICLCLSPLREGKYGNGNIIYQVGDATNLPYSDNEFEVVYSNSLIEHVGRDNQHLVAEEIRRVSQRYWVQVPYRYTPLEPHYSFPFFWYLPHPIRRLIARYWTSAVKKINYYAAEIDTIWLLDHQEMRKFFPDALILEERIAGFCKSLMACRPSSASDNRTP